MPSFKRSFENPINKNNQCKEQIATQMQNQKIPSCNEKFTLKTNQTKSKPYVWVWALHLENKNKELQIC
jgi:hypothetical protein